MSLTPNTLYYGDCLDWMRRWDDASVDLIYLDPPFNSKANYNVLYAAEGGGDAQYRAFNDTWVWDEAAADRLALYDRAIARPARNAILGLHTMLGPSGMLSYLTYMAERLEECWRLLKPTGSIYLHCDPYASHYLKVLLDGICRRPMRNEIVWRIGWVSGFKTQKRGWIRNHDTILYYVKSDAAHHAFVKEYIPYPKGYRRRDGQKPTGKGIPIEDTWNCHTGDVLNSIMIMSYSREKVGYDTQKPLKLLKRIIRASCPPGGIVLDPFCGCGTTVVAASQLGRKWAGIDISSFAIDLIRKKRLSDQEIPAEGIPYDLASAMKLARENPFSFESWAVMRLPGFAPNTRQVADGGVDGRATLAYKPDDYPSRLALAQVKGGNFSLSALRDFAGVTDSRKAALGCYITLKPVRTPAARRVALDAGKVTVSGYQYPRMQLWPITDYFDDRPPRLPVMNDPYNGKPLEQLEMFG